ncbi:hypothetical protein QR680_013280 [Steinernema hermaphroditum]|uniref:Uncharacterized protein n=1 Tax=Steinernema hermaphroditum TaxID=289476 RepID=A0AA39M201_9BILA|nr:hypothetical protein QR680_013280 [Steinernema hermaphroditum]
MTDNEDRMGDVQAQLASLQETQEQMTALMKRFADKLEAKSVPVVQEKPLKSSNLERQVKLNSEWISRIMEMAGDNNELQTFVEAWIFSAVSECLMKFNEYEASNPNTAASYAGTAVPEKSCHGFGHMARQCPQGPAARQ